NIELLESLYQQYKKNPEQLDPSWRIYFQNIDAQPIAQPVIVEAAAPRPVAVDLRSAELIEAYRQYGHLFAKTNPIALKELEEPEQLQRASSQFQPGDLDRLFLTHGILDKEQAPLRDILDVLQTIYSGSIGFDYKGLQDPEKEEWIQQQIESHFYKKELT